MASDNVIIQENGGITVVVTNDPNIVKQTVVVPQAGNSVNVAPSNNQLEETIIVSRGIQGPAGSSGTSGTTGTSGSSGSSGVNGTSGSSGTN